MRKKVRWLTPEHLMDIFFDEVSRAYVIDGNVMIHIGSAHEEENAEYIIKREKARLILPKRKVAQIIEDLKSLEKFLSEEEKQENENRREEEALKTRLGKPFPT